MVAVATVVLGLLCSGLVATHASAKPLNNKQLRNVASNLIAQNASSWGLTGKYFVPQRVLTGTDGLSTVRFQQTVSGLKVLDSLVAITLTTDGTFVSQTSTTSDEQVAPARTLKKLHAKKQIVSKFAQAQNVKKKNIAIRSLTPVFVDPVLTKDLADTPSIVWTAVVTDKSNILSVSNVYLTDTNNSTIKITPLVKKATTRPAYPSPLVCDLQLSQPSGNLTNRISTGTINNVRRKWVGQLSGYPLCEKNDPGRIADSSLAIQSINETVDFFWNALGVDIESEYYLGNVSPLANFGKNVNAATYCDPSAPTSTDSSCIPAISGFTNVCVYDSTSKSVDCPMENAFWVPWASSDCRSGACSGIFFGQGFEAADDVVAHELAHGVTGADAFLDGVCDNCDAGGISEALSDIFGEIVDQLNVTPGETPDSNWQMGEDVNGGPFRNMAMNGTTRACKSGQSWTPIKFIDSAYDSTCEVHTTLGPADRLAWLLANGGKQNGITVKPIGVAPWGTNGKYALCNSSASNCTSLVNVGRLFVQTLKKINGNVSYSGFGTQVSTACTDLTKAKVNPFTATYCAQVKNALAATGISKLSLLLTTRPTLAKTNASVTVSGKFSAANAVAAAGTTISLQHKATNSTTWVTLKSLISNTSGVVTTSVIFPSSGQYRLSTKPNTLVGNYVSPAVNITVTK